MSAEIFNVNGVPTIRIENESDVNGYTLIDVRREDEYVGELGHVAGAKLLTLGPDLQEFMETHNKSDKILFICRSGARSATATSMAMDFGFTQVFNLEGGMIAWNDKGLETES